MEHSTHDEEETAVEQGFTETKDDGMEGERETAVEQGLMERKDNGTDEDAIGNPQSAIRNPAEGMDAEAEAEMMRRLRALGYVE